MKTCRDCREDKELTEFYFHSAAADCRQARCKKCDNEARIRRRQKIPDPARSDIVLVTRKQAEIISGPVWNLPPDPRLGVKEYKDYIPEPESRARLRTAQSRTWARYSNE